MISLSLQSPLQIMKCTYLHSKARILILCIVLLNVMITKCFGNQENGAFELFPNDGHVESLSAENNKWNEKVEIFSVPNMNNVEFNDEMHVKPTNFYYSGNDEVVHAMTANVNEQYKINSEKVENENEAKKKYAKKSSKSPEMQEKFKTQKSKPKSFENDSQQGQKLQSQKYSQQKSMKTKEKPQKDIRKGAPRTFADEPVSAMSFEAENSPMRVLSQSNSVNPYENADNFNVYESPITQNPQRNLNYYYSYRDPRFYGPYYYHGYRYPHNYYWNPYRSNYYWRRLETAPRSMYEEISPAYDTCSVKGTCPMPVSSQMSFQPQSAVPQESILMNQSDRVSRARMLPEISTSKSLFINNNMQYAPENFENQQIYAKRQLYEQKEKGKGIFDGIYESTVEPVLQVIKRAASIPVQIIPGSLLKEQEDKQARKESSENNVRKMQGLGQFGEEMLDLGAMETLGQMGPVGQIGEMALMEQQMNDMNQQGGMSDMGRVGEMMMMGEMDQQIMRGLEQASPLRENSWRIQNFANMRDMEQRGLGQSFHLNDLNSNVYNPVTYMRKAEQYKSNGERENQMRKEFGQLYGNDDIQTWKQMGSSRQLSEMEIMEQQMNQMNYERRMSEAGKAGEMLWNESGLQAMEKLGQTVPVNEYYWNTQNFSNARTQGRNLEQNHYVNDIESQIYLPTMQVRKVEQQKGTEEREKQARKIRGLGEVGQQMLNFGQTETFDRTRKLWSDVDQQTRGLQKTIPLNQNYWNTENFSNMRKMEQSRGFEQVPYSNEFESNMYHSFIPANEGKMDQQIMRGLEETTFPQYTVKNVQPQREFVPTRQMKQMSQEVTRKVPADSESESYEYEYESTTDDNRSSEEEMSEEAFSQQPKTMRTQRN